MKNFSSGRHTQNFENFRTLSCKNRHFRVRSSSKGSFYSTRSSKEKVMIPEEKIQQVALKKVDEKTPSGMQGETPKTLKIKANREKLEKIVRNGGASGHVRQKSEHVPNTFEVNRRQQCQQQQQNQNDGNGGKEAVRNATLRVNIEAVKTQQYEENRRIGIGRRLNRNIQDNMLIDREQKRPGRESILQKIKRNKVQTEAAPLKQEDTLLRRPEEIHNTASKVEPQIVRTEGEIFSYHLKQGKLRPCTTKTRQEQFSAEQQKGPNIEVQNIDTAEDIKMLGKINTLFDPFRMLEEEEKKNSYYQDQFQTRPEETAEQSEYKRLKSLSSSKKSKLTDKINTLIFHKEATRSKKKSKSSPNKKNSVVSASERNSAIKFHRNKFENTESHGGPFSQRGPMKLSLDRKKKSKNDQGEETTVEKKESVSKKASEGDHDQKLSQEQQQMKDAQNLNEQFSQQLMTSSENVAKTSRKDVSSPFQRKQTFGIKAKGKKQQAQSLKSSYRKANAKFQMNPSQKYLKNKYIYASNRLNKEEMDKYWQKVNESLILCKKSTPTDGAMVNVEQQGHTDQYISKQLADFVANEQFWG